MQTETPGRSHWLNHFFTSYYDHRPVNATFIGVHDRDHRLPDYSEHGVGDALADMQSLAQQARRLTSPPKSRGG